MSEEIKEILGTINNDIENYYVGTNGCLYQDLTKEQLLLIKNYITNLQQKVEQLEKENNKKLYTSNHNQFTKYELLDDYERILKINKQLENIRKEAIEFIRHKQLIQEQVLQTKHYYLSSFEMIELLNILNKGSESNE